jgi:hypothetical protein
MSTTKCLGAAAVALALTLAAGAEAAGGQAVRRAKAVEIARVANAADEAVLARPLALAFAAGRLFVADAQDCAIKVFSEDGRFLKAFGRKGNGPGELSFPSGVSAAGDVVVVADKLNFRIQIFSGEGSVRGGFKLPFAPDRVLALGAERFLVTGNPTGRRAGERLLHIYDAAGRVIWEGLAARTSSNPTLDTFQNMVLACPAEGGDFYVVFRSGERAISRFTSAGELRETLNVDERLAFKPLNISVGGSVIRLLGFCWAAAWDKGLLYLSAPEPVGGLDLGPGRTLSVIDGRGRLQAVVDLACTVHRFVVAGSRVFAIDDEGELRIFEIVR